MLPGGAVYHRVLHDRTRSEWWGGGESKMQVSISLPDDLFDTVTEMAPEAKRSHIIQVALVEWLWNRMAFLDDKGRTVVRRYREQWGYLNPVEVENGGENNA